MSRISGKVPQFSIFSCRTEKKYRIFCLRRQKDCRYHVRLPAHFAIFSNPPQKIQFTLECQRTVKAYFFKENCVQPVHGTKMKNINLRIVMSAVCLASILAAFVKVEAGPVRFDQVVQIMNAKPGKAETSSFARLSVVNYYDGIIVADDDDDKDKKKAPQQDGRVITETKSDIVEDENCDCEQPPPGGKFPKWALLGLAAIPIAFILINRKKDTPTPTTTPTPPVTPTPTPPQPVPEPVTILLFGTGLASIGLAARRRFGKKRDDEEGEDKE